MPVYTNEGIEQILENQLALIEAIDRQLAFAQVSNPQLGTGTEKVRGKLQDCYARTNALLGKTPPGFGSGPYGR